jgi:hypothetical protein
LKDAVLAALKEAEAMPTAWLLSILSQLLHCTYGKMEDFDL